MTRTAHLCECGKHVSVKELEWSQCPRCGLYLTLASRRADGAIRMPNGIAPVSPSGRNAKIVF